MHSSAWHKCIFILYAMPEPQKNRQYRHQGGLEGGGGGVAAV